MDDLAGLDFSFTCNKCPYSTKSILEIKEHSMIHSKADAEQRGTDQSEGTEAELVSSLPLDPPDDPNEFNDDDDDDDGVMVDIPVLAPDDIPVLAPDIKEENRMIEDEEGVEQEGNAQEVSASKAVATEAQMEVPGETLSCQTSTMVDSGTDASLSCQTSTMVDSGTDASTMATSTDSAVDMNEEILVSIGTEVAVAKKENTETISSASSNMVDAGTQMVDMGTQMEMPIAKKRGRPRGRSTGAAKRKAMIPVREIIEEPEFEEVSTEEEADVGCDQDYEPPDNNRILDEVNDAMLAAKRGRRPLTRYKLKGIRGRIAKQTAIPNDRYKCNTEECDFTCKYKKKLYLHKREVHGEEAVKQEDMPASGDEEESAEGDNENELFDGIVPHKRHKSKRGPIQEDRYTCNICKDFKCKFKKDLSQHKHDVHNVFSPEYKYVSRVATDRYQCPQCSYTSKYKRALVSHKRRVHPRPRPVIIRSSNTTLKKSPKPRIPSDRYKCMECDYVCKFKGLLKAHKTKMHKKELPVATKKAIKELECEHCGKIIRGTGHHLLRHLKTHTGEKPFECDICGAVFAEKGRLNVHKPIHNETRPWLCEECGKSFKRAINLRMHRKIHVEVKPYQCQLCAYRCTRHDTLNLHMKRKHLKLRRVLCTFCGKKFFSEKECQAHTARKHLPRPTPFQCTLCPAAFPFAYNLRAHMKKHPEHKPYKCEYCGFESRSKASLQDHERQHTDVGGGGGGGGGTPATNPGDPEHKPYHCGYCGFQSRSKAYMKDHERQHTGEKDKKCDLCDYATTTSSNLYKHRKRQHGILGMPAKHSKGRGRPPRANAFLAAQAMAAAVARNTNSSTPPMAHQHNISHQVQPVSLTITAEDLAGNRHPPVDDERSGESIEDGDGQQHVSVQIHPPIPININKERSRPAPLMYGREKSIIGSVITEALAEARNVVQSDLYAGHMIPTSMPTNTTSMSMGLPASTLTPLTVAHGGSTYTMAHMPHGAIPHGAVVNLPEGMIPTGIPLTAQGIPVSVAMQNSQPPGPATMFSSMMNMHY